MDFGVVFATTTQRSEFHTDIVGFALLGLPRLHFRVSTRCSILGYTEAFQFTPWVLPLSHHHRHHRATFYVRFVFA